MGKAWTILLRAIRDITDNPVVALQVSVVPILLVTYLGQPWLDHAVAVQQGAVISPGATVWWLWAGGLVVTVFPLLWLAVGWYRFVLLGERPWPVAPRLHWGRILAYGGRSLLVLVIAVIAVGALVMLLGLLIGAGASMLGAERGQAGLLGAQIGGITGTFLGAYVFLYLSPAVVASACGRIMNLGEALGIGDHFTVPVFWLTLASLGLAWLLDAITGLLNLGGVMLGGYVMASNWFLILFNVGLLTALLAVAEPAPLPPPAEPATPWR